MDDKIKLVKHLADLGMLTFSDKEMEEMVDNMQEIIGLIDQIKEADVSGVQPKITSVAFNDLRKDEAKPSFEKEEILTNAQKKLNGTFVVAKVVD